LSFQTFIINLEFLCKSKKNNAIFALYFAYFSLFFGSGFFKGKKVKK